MAYNPVYGPPLVYSDEKLKVKFYTIPHSKKLRETLRRLAEQHSVQTLVYSDEKLKVIFDESDHPRGQPGNAGQFREKDKADAKGTAGAHEIEQRSDKYDFKEFPLSMHDHKKGTPSGVSGKTSSAPKSTDSFIPTGKTNEEAVVKQLYSLKKTVKTGNECASSMLEDGTLLDTLEGVKGDVTLTDEFISKIDSQPVNSVILLHTHLKAISFSTKDILTMFKHPSIKELRIIDNADTMYTLRMGKREAPTSEAVEDLMEKMVEIESELNIQYDKLVKAGKLSEKDKEKIVRRERNKMLFGRNYQEEL